MYIIFDASYIGYRVLRFFKQIGFENESDTEEVFNEIFDEFIVHFLIDIADLTRVIERTRPWDGIKFSKILICWDGAYSVVSRRKIYPKYKVRDSIYKERKFLYPFRFFDKTKEVLSEVSPRLSLCDSEAEADDLIAVMCELFEDSKTCIVTTDSDMFQLVGENTHIYDPMKKKWIDKANVIERMGIGPAKIVKYKALVGDPTDNIPGMRGMGIKRARVWMRCEWKKLFKLYGKELEVFRDLIELPFKHFDVDRFLRILSDKELDAPLDWERLFEKYEFDEIQKSRVERIT